MIPWETLDTADVPDGGGTLKLMRRGGEYSIMAGSTELMNSRLFGSEEALAKLASEALETANGTHVLIGGLGMGFTLRAALAAFGPGVRVTVGELVPQVVDWARGPMAEVFGGSLDDPRVALALGDVAETIAGSAPETFDAILLDVDNGPDGLTRANNDRLYGAKGLGEARCALKPGGVLAVWSSHPDDAFTRRLSRAGFHAEARRVRASTKKRGARHVVWIARRP